MTDRKKVESGGGRRGRNVSKGTREHLYGDPLIYDILHKEGTREDVLVFERLSRRWGRKDTRSWLEPACGSGRYLLVLAARGSVAVGLDMSEEMLAYVRSEAGLLAKGAGKRVKTMRGTMERFSLRGLVKDGKIDAAFNPINSIRHLGSDAAMISHLRCMKKSLREGGVYIVGMSLSAYGLEDISEDVWKGARVVNVPVVGSADGTSRLVRTRSTAKERMKVQVTQVVQFLPPTHDSKGAWKRRERVLSHLTITESRAGSRSGSARTQHRDSAYWLRTYNKREWESVVAKAGMRVLQTCSNTGEAMKASEPGYYLYVLGAAE